MSEESTTPDLVERFRAAFEAGQRRDLDAVMDSWAPDAAWDLSPMGLGTFEGREAIRGFYDEWYASFASIELELQEITDYGNGVGLCANVLKGRPHASSGEVELRQVWVFAEESGLTVSQVSYTDIDEARAAAERLAEGRG